LKNSNRYVYKATTKFCFAKSEKFRKMIDSSSSPSPSQSSSSSTSSTLTLSTNFSSLELRDFGKDYEEFKEFMAWKEQKRQYQNSYYTSNKNKNNNNKNNNNNNNNARASFQSPVHSRQTSYNNTHNSRYNSSKPSYHNNHRNSHQYHRNQNHRSSKPRSDRRNNPYHRATKHVDFNPNTSYSSSLSQPHISTQESYSPSRSAYGNTAIASSVSSPGISYSDVRPEFSPRSPNYSPTEVVIKSDPSVSTSAAPTTNVEIAPVISSSSSSTDMSMHLL
jgi:hypothetical protein